MAEFKKGTENCDWTLFERIGAQSHTRNLGLDLRCGRLARSLPPADGGIRGHCSGLLRARASISCRKSGAWPHYSPRLTRSMGRKAGGLYINPKKFGAVGKPCMKEMVSFLGCLSLNKNNDDKCVRQKDLLLACVETQRGKPKNPARTINYHLQRLGRDKFL